MLGVGRRNEGRHVLIGRIDPGPRSARLLRPVDPIADDVARDAKIALDRMLAAWLFEARGVRLGYGDFGSPYIPAEVRRAGAVRGPE